MWWSGLAWYYLCKHCALGTHTNEVSFRESVRLFDLMYFITVIGTVNVSVDHTCSVYPKLVALE